MFFPLLEVRENFKKSRDRINVSFRRHTAKSGLSGSQEKQENELEHLTLPRAPGQMAPAKHKPFDQVTRKFSCQKKDLQRPGLSV